MALHLLLITLLFSLAISQPCSDSQCGGCNSAQCGGATSAACCWHGGACQSSPCGGGAGEGEGSDGMEGCFHVAQNVLFTVHDVGDVSGFFNFTVVGPGAGWLAVGVVPGSSCTSCMGCADFLVGDVGASDILVCKRTGSTNGPPDCGLSASTYGWDAGALSLSSVSGRTRLSGVRSVSPSTSSPACDTPNAILTTSLQTLVFAWDSDGNYAKHSRSNVAIVTFDWSTLSIVDASTPTCSSSSCTCPTLDTLPPTPIPTSIPTPMPTPLPPGATFAPTRAPTAHAVPATFDFCASATSVGSGDRIIVRWSAPQGGSLSLRVSHPALNGGWLGVGISHLPTCAADSTLTCMAGTDYVIADLSGDVWEGTLPLETADNVAPIRQLGAFQLDSALFSPGNGVLDLARGTSSLSDGVVSLYVAWGPSSGTYDPDFGHVDRTEFQLNLLSSEQDTNDLCVRVDPTVIDSEGGSPSSPGGPAAEPGSSPTSPTSPTGPSLSSWVEVVPGGPLEPLDFVFRFRTRTEGDDAEPTSVDLQLSWSHPLQGVAWVAVGFFAEGEVPANRMGGCDILMIAPLADGEARVTDRWSDDYVSPQADDQQDVVVTEVVVEADEEVDGGATWTVTLSRTLDTGDARDVSFGNGPVGLIFATRTGAGSFASQHDIALALVDPVDLVADAQVTVTISDTRSDVLPFIAAHGAILLLSWFVLLPAAGLLARLGKSVGHVWYTTHRAVGSVGTLASVAAVALAVVSVDRSGGSHIVNTSRSTFTLHALLGIGVVVLAAVLQLPLGVLANRMWSPDRKGTPLFPDKVHLGLGKVLYLMGSVNSILGFYVLADKFPDLVSPTLAIVIVILVALGSLFLLILFATRFSWKHAVPAYVAVSTAVALICLLATLIDEVTAVVVAILMVMLSMGLISFITRPPGSTTSFSSTDKGAHEMSGTGQDGG